MDPTTAVRTDTLPAIATVVAPGACVSSTYLIALLSAYPRLEAALGRHEAIALTAAILVFIICGFALDSLGSYVEFYWIDKPRQDRAEMLEIWWRPLDTGRDGTDSFDYDLS